MNPLPIAITMGDPAGIGPEIIGMLYRDRPQDMRDCVVVGDPAWMRRTLQALGAMPEVMVLGGLEAWRAAAPGQMPVLAVPGDLDRVVPGQVCSQTGAVAARAVVVAARAALSGQVSAMVTAPLHKKALALAGVDFPGHTELLQAEAARHRGVPVSEMPVRMMLANPELRTVLVSIHVSLREAIDAVTTANVLQTLRITGHALSGLPDFAGKRPVRMAVAGLNPHAGEDGLFGREEIEVIAPAVEQARQEGWQVEGPLPPDTVFMRARRGEFDVVIAMYHDQGLIPVKYLGVEQGVNVTLGLPLLRTSPDHGTALDIVGQGVADPSSLWAALQMARQMAGQAAGRS
jgi:4-hydroxythreonine-4-phosphate dehydrogenase